MADEPTLKVVVERLDNLIEGVGEIKTWMHDHDESDGAHRERTESRLGALEGAQRFAKWAGGLMVVVGIAVAGIVKAQWLR